MFKSILHAPFKSFFYLKMKIRFEIFKKILNQNILLETMISETLNRENSLKMKKTNLSKNPVFRKTSF